MPQVTANGRSYEVAAATTVADFVRARGLDPRYVVVERNGEPLPRTRAEETRLAEGDVLELVRAVAGGADTADSGCAARLTAAPLA